MDIDKAIEKDFINNSYVIHFLRNSHDFLSPREFTFISLFLTLPYESEGNKIRVKEICNHLNISERNYQHTVKSLKNKNVLEVNSNFTEEGGRDLNSYKVDWWYLYEKITN